MNWYHTLLSAEVRGRIDVAKHIFLPEGFGPFFSTISINDLNLALAHKRLGRIWPTPTRKRVWSPFTDRWVWGRAPSDRRVVRAKIWCDGKMLGDLRSGLLIAHTHCDATGQFRRIPTSYWHEEIAGLTLRGRMLDLEEGQTFAKEVAGNTVLVTGENARAWLEQQGITDTDPFFPDDLRMQNRPTHLPRNARYDWPSFENEAVARLHDEGAFCGKWNQARLEEHMLEWCGINWEKEPSRRIVRQHVKDAVRRFLSEKRIGLATLGN
jgi:hypothetical protein